MASSRNGERKRAGPDGPPPPPSADDPLYATDDYIMIGPNEPFAIPPGMSREEAIRLFQKAKQAAKEVLALYGDDRPADRIPGASLLPNSRHPMVRFTTSTSVGTWITVFPTVPRGSLIEMTGPKRGIEMRCDVLIEYDMKIKKGGKEEDDLQLIDGVSDFSAVYNTSCRAFMNRIDGDGGSVDITVTLIHRAVEATIEVVVSEVYETDGFDLCLSSFVSGIEKEIQLFHGVISEPCGLRSVVAVALDTGMLLKFKVCHGSRKIERCANFKATKHGSVSEDIKFDQASIRVKVTWSTLL